MQGSSGGNAAEDASTASPLNRLSQRLFAKVPRAPHCSFPRH